MDYLILLLISFISATILPMGSEAVLLYNLSNGLNPYILLFCATIGNSSGSLFNYIIGLKGEAFLEKRGYLSEKTILKLKKKFDNYGGYLLLLSWLPVIGDPITLVAGVLKYDLKKFIIIVVFAKFFRYLFVVAGYFMVF